MADERTIAQVEVEYLSQNGPAIEREFKTIVENLKQIQKLLPVTRELSTGFGVTQATAAAKQAQEMVKQLEARNRIEKQIINNQRELNKLSGNLYTPYKPGASESAKAAYMAKDYGMYNAAGERQYSEEEILRASGIQQYRMRQQMNPEQKVEYQMMRFQQVFRRVFDALISFVAIRAVTAVVGGFAKSLIDTNKVLENMDTRLRVMIGPGGALDGLKKEILTLTIHTPFIIKDFTEASVALTAFGINAQHNLKPIADWAAAIGKPLEDVALAFAKISIGSPRSALLLSTRGINKAEFDAELKKTGDRVTALVDVAERHFGDMSIEVSKTFQGLVTNIKDVWFQVSAILGKPLFLDMKNDLTIIYSLLTQILQSKSSVDGFSDSFKLLYEAFKGIAIFIALILVPTIITKLGTALSGAVANFKALGIQMNTTAVVGTSAAIAGFALMVEMLGKVIHAQLEYANAVKETTKNLNQFGAADSRTIQALQTQLDTIEQVKNQWGSIFSFAKLALGAVPFAGGEMDAFEKFFFRNLDKDKKSIDELIKHFQSLKEAREDAFAEHGEKFAAIDILNWQDELKNKLPGTIGVLQQLKSALHNFLASGPSVKRVGGDITPIGLGNVKTAEGAINDILGPSKRFQTIAEARAAIPQLMKTIQAPDANISEILSGFMSQIANLEKAGKEAKDYSQIIAEIAGAEEKLNALRNGEPKQLAQAAKFLKEQEDYQSDIQKLKDLGLKTDKEKELFYTLSLKEMLAEIGYLQIMSDRSEKLASINEKISDAQARQVKGGLELQVAAINAEYEKTADINTLYEGRKLELDSVNAALATAKKHMQDQEKAYNAINDPQQDVEKRQAYLEMVQSQDQITSLQREQLRIQQEMTKLPARSLGEGFSRAIHQMAIDLNSFNTDLSKMIIEGAQKTGGGYLSELIYGSTALSQNRATITDLNAQLNVVRVNEERSLYNASILNRYEGESNDAYLTRVKTMSQMNNIAQTQFVYKTQELEILSKINQAENERNQILLDRLAKFGQSIINKMTDQLAGMAVSGFGKFLNGLGGGGGGYTGPQVGAPGTDFGPGLQSAGGVHFHLEGATIYGQQDFNQAVDQAVQKMSNLRSR